MYHYVYRITYKSKYYVGKRSSKLKPQQDIGLKYFTSGILHDEFKMHPNKFKIKIVRMFNSSTNVINFEIKYHARLNVGSHPKFYNRANQLSNGFDTTNHVVSNKGYVHVNELNDNCWPISKGHTTVKDKHGKCSRVSIDDPKYISGELTHIAMGMTSAIDQNGNTVYITSNKYASGNFITNRTNRVPVKDKYGNILDVATNDPRYLSGELVHVYHGLVSAKNIITGETRCVSKDEFINDPQLVGINAGKISGKNNPRAKITKVYDNNNELRYVANGNFKELCKTKKLPFAALSHSARNNGEKIHTTNRSLTSKFRFWYATYS